MKYSKNVKRKQNAYRLEIHPHPTTSEHILDPKRIKGTVSPSSARQPEDMASSRPK